MERNGFGDLHRQTGREMLGMADHYNLKNGIPKRLLDRLDLVLNAVTPQEADRLSRKVVSAMEAHCLSEMVHGRAHSTTAEYYESLASKADNTASMLNGKHPEASAKQRELAARYRAVAVRLSKGEYIGKEERS